MNQKRCWKGWLRRRAGARDAIIEVTPAPVALRPKVGFSLAPTILGNLMVAADVDGVCWIGIHRSPDFLEAELRADFPQAEVLADDAMAAPLARMIVDEMESARGELALPIVLEATPFQLSVWRELCSIPRGATRSYGEIARRLGRPTATRAVGRANGANPLAVIIPCHRAIGTDGALTGYRWGLVYKQRLLEHERRGIDATAPATLADSASSPA